MLAYISKDSLGNYALFKRIIKLPEDSDFSQIDSCMQISEHIVNKLFGGERFIKVNEFEQIKL